MAGSNEYEEKCYDIVIFLTFNFSKLEVSPVKGFFSLLFMSSCHVLYLNIHSLVIILCVNEKCNKKI